jgi:CelD/BcsL family acetyltransferase involved in cellulose biosynthesis
MGFHQGYHPYGAKEAKRVRSQRRRPRRNPARKARVTTTTTRTRIVRRSNPSRPVFALVARRKGGGKLLRFTGTKFSDHGKAKLFPSLEELRSWAKRLRGQYGAVLKHYDLYSDTRYVK